MKQYPDFANVCSGLFAFLIVALLTFMLVNTQYIIYNSGAFGDSIYSIFDIIIYISFWAVDALFIYAGINFIKNRKKVLT